MTRKLTLPGTVILLAVTCSACINRSRSGDSTPAATSPPKIKVTNVIAGNLNRQVELAASVEGYEMAELMPRIDGYVGEVHVNIGDSVTKGQALATLKVPELADAVQQKHELVKQCEADIASKRAEVALADASLQSHQAALELKQLEQKRFKALVDRGSLNQQKLDEVEFALKSAEADLRRATAEVEAAKAHIAAAEAVRDVALSNLQMAETMARYREIVAPFEGLITARMIDSGEYVRPASSGAGTPMFRIARVDRLRVVVFLPLALAGYVSKDDSIIVHDLPALPGKRIDQIGGQPLTIARFANAFDADSRLMRVEIDIDNQDLHDSAGITLKPGDYGRVTLTLEQLAGNPMVPRSAVGTNSKGEHYVIRVDETNTCFAVIIDEILVEDSKHAVLKSDKIRVGDRVVISDLDRAPQNETLGGDRLEVVPPQ